MKRILLSGILFMCSFLVLAQSSNFKGTIYEEDSDEIVADALVTVEGTTLITKSDDNGSFYFSKTVPVGDQVVTVSKDGYEVKYFVISIEPGKNVNVDRVEIEMTSKEKKRRSRLSKELRKEEKERERDREDKIKEARKEREKKDKRLAKEKKRLKKRNRDVIVSYDEADEPEATTETLTENRVAIGIVPDEISPIQEKYGPVLGIPADEVTNIKLYEFIDNWYGTPYRMGGATKEGIDCSSFSQRLFTSVFDQYIERTAQKQFDSRYTDKFQGKEFLKEGDLVFFKGVGESSDQISHVGIYLGNSKFVHSTSRRGVSGAGGVKISNISDAFWTSRFVAGGRRINNN